MPTNSLSGATRELWLRGRLVGSITRLSRWTPHNSGDPARVAQDEGFRPDCDVATLSKLRTVRLGDTVTAGNAAQQNDAAAACLIVAEDALERLGLEPIALLQVGRRWAATRRAWA